MAIVVADGTGLVNADSYVSVSFLEDFANTILDYSLSTLTTEQKENLAKAGTDYLDSYDYKGSKLKSNQALSFPRVNIGESGIPEDVKKATVCFAIHRQVHGLINTHSGSNTDLSNNSNRLITKRTRKIGEVTIQDEYSNIHNVYSISRNSSSNAIQDPTQISYVSKGERYLRDFLTSGTFYFERED